MAVITQIQQRRDTLANWTATNPVLAAGEMSYVTDLDCFKVGDGATAWNALGYHAPYGKEYNLVQSQTVSTTTLTALQDKINSSVTLNTAGTYKVNVCFQYNADANTSDFIASFLFDGAALGADATGIIVQHEPKDNTGNFGGSFSNQRYTYNMNYYVTTTAGAKAILLQYQTEVVGVEASIWDASVEIIKVSN